jgi:hypothetical protein
MSQRINKILHSIYVLKEKGLSLTHPKEILIFCVCGGGGAGDFFYDFTSIADYMASILG